MKTFKEYILIYEQQPQQQVQPQQNPQQAMKNAVAQMQTLFKSITDTANNSLQNLQKTDPTAFQYITKTLMPKTSVSQLAQLAANPNEVAKHVQAIQQLKAKSQPQQQQPQQAQQQPQQQQGQQPPARTAGTNPNSPRNPNAGKNINPTT